MFGGIVKHQGKIVQIDLRRGRFHIYAPSMRRHFSKGNSIAVDGICLTVTSSRGGTFTVDITPETIRRTHLRWARPGWIVNLESPLRMSDLIHGHIVLGHVDGIGYVCESGNRPRGGWILGIRVPRMLAPLMPYKGSVAVNGVSLTLARATGTLIEIALIPETLRRTNLRFLRPGSRVNLEADVLARYVLGRKIWK